MFVVVLKTLWGADYQFNPIIGYLSITRYVSLRFELLFNGVEPATNDSEFVIRQKQKVAFFCCKRGRSFNRASREAVAPDDNRVGVTAFLVCIACLPTVIIVVHGVA